MSRLTDIQNELSTNSGLYVDKSDWEVANILNSKSVNYPTKKDIPSNVLTGFCIKNVLLGPILALIDDATPAKKTVGQTFRLVIENRFENYPTSSTEIYNVYEIQVGLLGTWGIINTALKDEMLALCNDYLSWKSFTFGKDSEDVTAREIGIARGGN